MKPTELEDTKLPVTPAMRKIFNGVAISSRMAEAANPDLKDDGLSPISLKLKIRCGEVLGETMPAADPEQVAAAFLFLNPVFFQPVLMQRAYGEDCPKMVAWSKEWKNIQRGLLRLSDASVELRQIITAAHVAMMEGIKNNFSTVSADAVRWEMDEQERMMIASGDIQAPALEKRFRDLRVEIGALLDSAKPAVKAPKPPQP